MAWKVIIDNGRDYAAALPGLFDTEDEARMAGEDWLSEFRFVNSLDDEDPAGFDVVKQED